MWVNENAFNLWPAAIWRNKTDDIIAPTVCQYFTHWRRESVLQTCADLTLSLQTPVITAGSNKTLFSYKNWVRTKADEWFHFWPLTSTDYVLHETLGEVRVRQMHIMFVCLWVFQWLQKNEVEVKHVAFANAMRVKCWTRFFPTLATEKFK